MAVYVSVAEMAKQFRDWQINTELLRETGFQDLGPSGTRTGRIEATKLLPAVTSNDPGHRIIAARALHLAVRKLSPQFKSILGGCVRLAGDRDQDIKKIALSGVKQWGRHPEVFYLIRSCDQAVHDLRRIRYLPFVKSALEMPYDELEAAWILLRRDGRMWFKEEKKK